MQLSRTISLQNLDNECKIIDLQFCSEHPPPPETKRFAISALLVNLCKLLQKKPKNIPCIPYRYSQFILSCSYLAEHSGRSLLAGNDSLTLFPLSIRSTLQEQDAPFRLDRLVIRIPEISRDYLDNKLLQAWSNFETPHHSIIMRDLIQPHTLIALNCGKR